MKDVLRGDNKLVLKSTCCWHFVQRFVVIMYVLFQTQGETKGPLRGTLHSAGKGFHQTYS